MLTWFVKEPTKKKILNGVTMFNWFIKLMGYKTPSGRWDWSEIRVDIGVLFIVTAGAAAWYFSTH